MASEKKKNPDELRDELAKIYTDRDGQLPDFTRLDGKPGSRLKSVMIGSLLFLLALAAVAWAGFFFFFKTPGFTGEGVEMIIESDERLTAGRETEIVIRYRNRERIPLARASLAVERPDGFVLLGSEPPPNESGEWPVGSIEPGGVGSIRLTGWTRREVDETLTFRAELNYRPADFNADFQKVASHTVVVGDSVLALKGSGPEQMTPGDDIAFVYEYENASDRRLENLRFVIDPLDGFVFSSAEPAPDADIKGRWTIPALEPRAKGTITVRGTFTSAARGPKQLHARLGLVDGENFVVLARGDAGTDVLKSDLAVGMIVNGSSRPVTVSFGDTLFFTLNYENSGDVAMKDVVLSADLASEPPGVQLLDWVSLKDDLEGKLTGSTIAWNKKQIADLALLKPGDKGAINFSVQLIKKPPFAEASGGEPALSTKRLTINAKAIAKIGKVGSTSTGREIVSDPLVIRLNSDAAFKAYGRWFDESGAPLGSGSLPPQAGQKTVYRVFWIVQNTLHELTNVSVTTLLPQGVKWTGVERPIDAGDLSFDETGRKAVWRLNKMPTSVQMLTVTFDVELAPEFEDIGKIVNLTGENRFEAFDKETETVILKTEPPIGTDLIGDEFAAGKGVVKE